MILCTQAGTMNAMKPAEMAECGWLQGGASRGRRKVEGCEKKKKKPAAFSNIYSYLYK